MSFDRRTLLAGVGAASAAAFAPRGVLAAARAEPLRAAVDGLAAALLDNAPETVTGLGLDSGPRAGAKAMLDDLSPASADRDAATIADYRARLGRIDPGGLGDSDKTLRASVIAALDLAIAGRRFAFGDNSFAAAMSESARPYMITQQASVIGSTPVFLDNQHSIQTRTDADAYIARLSQLAGQIDQETARLAADTAQGVVAPDFILDNAIGQIKDARAAPVADQTLVQSIAGRAKAKGIDGDWAGRAAKIIETAINPALDRQLTALAAARAKATSDAGVWKLADGPAYYEWSLQVGTTTRLTADQIHQIGLEQNNQIEARMDAILRGRGLTQGTVTERTRALTTDPKFVFPDSEAGRAALIDYLNGLIAATRPRLKAISKLTLRAEVIVKRVPAEIQDGAPQGYMNPGSLDGSRPSIYYINLKSMGNWPKWQLPTLTAHETIPGHAWQTAYLVDHRDQTSLMSAIMGFNGFVEGWALYAEQLNDELGAYDADPLGRLGYLQAQRFRAGRLVVDTGLHAKRWTRAQAIDWLIDNTGRARDSVTSEIDRYCASPGQACGYKVGHNELIRLRAKAMAALGPRFDLRDYNDAVVATGGVPLTVLESAIDAYIARTKA